MIGNQPTHTNREIARKGDLGASVVVMPGQVSPPETRVIRMIAARVLLASGLSAMLCPHGASKTVRKSLMDALDAEAPLNSLIAE